MAPKLTLTDGHRISRSIMIWLWIPAFGFLLGHGISTGELCPVLGIIPMTISLFISVVHIAGKARFRGANIFMDLFAAVFLMGILIPSWIMLPEGNSWRSSRGAVMAGTYGTVPMMVNFCLHSYFVLREINWRYVPLTETVCPHCDRHIKIPKGKAMVENKDSYQPLTMADNTASASFHEGRAPDEYNDNVGRPSTDDETARLV